MPTLIDDAVCVRHWDFSETSQTVSLFTRGHGVLRGLAKGAKRERGRFSGGIDLLVRGEVVAIVKAGRELATLTDWNLLQTWRRLREELDANRAAFCIADLASRFVVDDAPHPRTWDAMIQALDSINEHGAIDVALLRFEWIMLDECGYRPRLEGGVDSSGASAFSAADGGLVARGAVAGAWPVRQETVAALRAIERDGDVAFASIEPAAIRRAGLLLAAYSRELMGFEPPTLRAAWPELP